MNHKATNDEKVKAYLNLMGNPYASLSVFDEPAEARPKQLTVEEKRSRFRHMQNPYAYFDFFGEPEADEENQGTRQTQLELASETDCVPQASKAARADVEKELNEVLRLYRPYVARKEWARVMVYRTEFLEGANWTVSNSARVVDKLQRLKFTLMPGEKVEHNRAPAERIISELKRLLT